MAEEFDLTEYMNKGIENIVKRVIKATLTNPNETAFILKYAVASKEAIKKRDNLKCIGVNVPAFLISSITSNCNMFCKGCYARLTNLVGKD